MEEVGVSKVPQRISDDHNFGITPFGVFCFECGVPIGKGLGENVEAALRVHVRRKHNNVPIDTTSFISDSLMKAISNQFCHTRNYDLWIREKGIERYKCTCGVVFCKKSNYQRHAKKAEKDHPESSHCLTNVKTVMSVCGRVIEETKIKEMMGRSVMVVDTNTSIDFIPIQMKNEKWITMQLADIKKLFAPYKRPNESLDPYLASLKLVTIHQNGPVIGSITSSLNLIDDDRSKNDKSLNFFMDCTEKWVKNYCREHVRVLDGQTRFHLQSYFDESVLVNPGYKLNFNMRENEDVILKEVMLIIEFSWKLHENGSCGDILASTITEIKKEIIQSEKYYDGIASDTAVEAMIQGLLIQRYLYSILIETMDNAFFLLFGHHIIMLRLFKVNKAHTVENDGNKLSMRSCGEFGSNISLHIHIYRLATASLLACTERKCWDGILNKAKNAPLCHMVSPLINQTKAMNNEKLDVRNKQLKDNGDIIIDDFYFHKSKWSMLIPNLCKLFDDVLNDIFVGLDWKLFADVSNEVHVSRMNDDDQFEKHQIFHYEYYVDVNGKLIKDCDLDLVTGLGVDSINRLNALAMLSLHGLGLGATRIAELYRIFLHQITWKNNAFYYVTVSNKRPSADVNMKKHVQHKVPIEISRYLLLFDTVAMTLSKGRETFIMPTSNDLDIDYSENTYFYNYFAKLMDLSSNCSGLVMRHLYTSICNYIFPSNNSTTKNSITTIAAMAEMSGHTLETHEMYYSTSIDKEGFFEKYHQCLGSNVFNHSSKAMNSMKYIDEDQLKNTLKIVYGTNAEYFSDLQREIIFDSANNYFQHSFCALGCGGGKSLSWIIPTLKRVHDGTRTNMTIVIIPYCFLVQHHYLHCVNLSNATRKFSVEYLIGSDISEQVFPNCLRDYQSLPSIIFVSLEAIAKLLICHFHFMKEIVEESLINKIFIDECHTLLTETNFRNKYFELTKLAALGVPIMSMSGSFPTKFISSYTKYMFNDCSNIPGKMFIDESLFGTQELSLRVIQTSNYLQATVSCIVDFLGKHSGYNIHVIVSTTDEGHFIRDILEKKHIDVEFIHSGSDDQDQVASKWGNNQLKVLISTTLGLVGNESINTQLVCIVGLLYDLLSVIQAMGRIRPNRRNDDSSMYIFIPTELKRQLHLDSIDSKINFTQLKSNKIIDSNCEDYYHKCMTATSVYEWITKDIGCRLVSLSRRLGYKGRTCKKCDNCTSTNINKASKLKHHNLRVWNKEKEYARDILERLKRYCLVCKKRSCIGICIVSNSASLQCFHCLGKHRARECKNDYKRILKDKACFSCYAYNMSQSDNHDYNTCSKDGQIKERLRGLIHYAYKEQRKKGVNISYINYLAGIYSSERSYIKFLYSFRQIT